MMRKILLIGPYFQNHQHGAEVGIVDGLRELGHEVTIFDNRVNRVVMGSSDMQLESVDKCLLFLQPYIFDYILCPGPGFPNNKVRRQLPNLIGKKICWNSEPLRLKEYEDRMSENVGLFDYYFTFDESEIPLYKKMGIEARWLPQAFNPKWYKPLGINKIHDCCFIGSTGQKWMHRDLLLNRLRKTFYVMHGATFDAKKVNQIYNESKVVLNLGLYSPGHCGDPGDFRSFGLQQRIFESIGAGTICVTNEIPEGTNEIFKQGTNILFYNKNNVEAVIKHALNDTYREKMEQNIWEIRYKHTYKFRMWQMLNMLEAE